MTHSDDVTEADGSLTSISTGRSVASTRPPEWCRPAVLAWIFGRDLTLAFGTTAGLAARLRQTEISPVGLADAGRDRIAEVEGRVHADITVMRDEARRAATAAEPAISVPCGFTAGGLPVGFQRIGRAFDEAAVLRAAHACEAGTPLGGRRPPR